MGIREDLEKYPVFQLIGGKIIKLRQTPISWNTWEWQAHHYIAQNWIKGHKDKFKEVEHLQKIFFLPTECHCDLHAGSRKFKQSWGVERSELIWGLEE